MVQGVDRPEVRHHRDAPRTLVLRARPARPRRLPRDPRHAARPALQGQPDRHPRARDPVLCRCDDRTVRRNQARRAVSARPQATRARAAREGHAATTRESHGRRVRIARARELRAGRRESREDADGHAVSLDAGRVVLDGHRRFRVDRQRPVPRRDRLRARRPRGTVHLRDPHTRVRRLRAHDRLPALPPDGPHERRGIRGRPQGRPAHRRPRVADARARRAGHAAAIDERLREHHATQGRGARVAERTGEARPHHRRDAGRDLGVPRPRGREHPQRAHRAHARLSEGRSRPVHARALAQPGPRGRPAGDDGRPQRTPRRPHPLLRVRVSHPTSGGPLGVDPHAGDRHRARRGRRPAVARRHAHRHLAPQDDGSGAAIEPEFPGTRGEGRRRRRLRTGTARRADQLVGRDVSHARLRAGLLADARGGAELFRRQDASEDRGSDPVQHRRGHVVRSRTALRLRDGPWILGPHLRFGRIRERPCGAPGRRDAGRHDPQEDGERPSQAIASCCRSRSTRSATPS